MAISPQRLTIYLYSAHRAVIFAIAQLSCTIRECLAESYMKKFMHFRDRGAYAPYAPCLSTPLWVNIHAVLFVSSEVDREPQPFRHTSVFDFA